MNLGTVGALGVYGTGATGGDTTAPVITLTPTTTTYNLTVGDSLPNIAATADDSSTVTFSDTGTATAGNAVVRTYSATDSSGNTGTATVTFNFEAVVVSNTAPTIATIANQSVAAGQTVTTTANASDVDDDSLTYSFRQISGTSVTLTGIGNQRTFTAPVSVTASDLEFGVIANDGNLNSAEATFRVNVAARPPIITGQTNETITVSEFGLDTLFLHTDNVFSVPLTTKTGTVLTEDFVQDISYFIGDKRGNVKLALALGNGVEIRDGRAIVSISKSDLTFYGEFTHQLIVTNSLMQRLPPMLCNQVIIQEVFKNY